MRLFIGALVLQFMVFFNEIEASGLRRVWTMPHQNDREGIDHLVTSRVPTQSSSTHNNPYLLAHQALDLGGHLSYDPQSFYPQSHGYHFHPQESLPQESHQYHPHPQEYLHQESSSGENLSGYLDHTEGIDYLVPSRFPVQSSFTHNNPPLQAHPALDAGVYQSYSPESFHQQSHGHHFYPQQPLRQLDPAEVAYLVNKYKFENGRVPKVDSTEWLARHYSRNKNRKKPEDSQDYSTQDNIEWLRKQKREFEIEVLNQARIQMEIERIEKTGSELVSMPSMRTNRYKNWYKESEFPRIISSQEEQPKKQRALRIREPVSSQSNTEESAINEHANREIGRRVKGKSAQTHVSGTRGKGKAVGQKGVSDSRFKAESAEDRRNVLDSHDQLSQQDQHSENDSDEFEPTLIPPHMSNYNPYLEFPKNDHNHQQNWNHPGGSGSG